MAIVIEGKTRFSNNLQVHSSLVAKDGVLMMALGKLKGTHTDKAVSFSLGMMGFVQRKRPFSYAWPPAHRQRSNYSMLSFGHGASVQKFQRKAYVPTSLLSDAEKAERREKVKLQVRAFRQRRKLRQAQESSQTTMGGFHHFPDDN